VDLLRSVEMEQFKSEIPVFSVGDRLRVNVKVVEGDKSRVQAFEGVVIAKRHGGISETFTVRRVTYGEGVERTFPIHSPIIDSIEVLSRGRIRRAKLYYLRSKSGKASRIKEIRQ